MEHYRREREMSRSVSAVWYNIERDRRVGGHLVIVRTIVAATVSASSVFFSLSLPSYGDCRCSRVTSPHNLISFSTCKLVCPHRSLKQFRTYSDDHISSCSRCIHISTCPLNVKVCTVLTLSSKKCESLPEGGWTTSRHLPFAQPVGGVTS